jgi:gamma-glutamyl-gamma-aminobutyrate hydrolase PuuD
MRAGVGTVPVVRREVVEAPGLLGVQWHPERLSVMAIPTGAAGFLVRS